MMGVQHKAVGIGFGIATALYVAEGLGEPAPAMLSLVASTVGCMLPDIDHDMSKIGRKRKLVTDTLNKLTSTTVLGMVVIAAVILIAFSIGMVNVGIDLTTVMIAFCGGLLFMGVRSYMMNSKTFKWLMKHRGFMHTLIPPALILLMASASEFVYWRFTFFGLGIGYLSHLLADMLTVEGCPILFPLSKANIRLLKLKTKNFSTWIAALALAGAPVVLVILYLEGSI